MKEGGAQYWQEHGSDKSHVYVSLCQKSLYGERVRVTRASPLSFIEYFRTPIRVISLSCFDSVFNLASVHSCGYSTGSIFWQCHFF